MENNNKNKNEEVLVLFDKKQKTKFINAKDYGHATIFDKCDCARIIETINTFTGEPVKKWVFQTENNELITIKIDKKFINENTYEINAKYQIQVLFTDFPRIGKSFNIFKVVGKWQTKK